MQGDLFQGTARPDDAVSDLQRFGVTVGAADLGLSDDSGVWPQNEVAVRAFLSVATQWRLLAQADGRTLTGGLDYAGVKAGLDLAGLTIAPGVWRDVQMIEQGAMAAARDRQR